MARGERTVIPVENADRFFLLAERSGLPVSCVWAFRFDTGTIDQDRFVRAVDRAMRQYPKAATKLRGREAFFGPDLSWCPLEDAASRACFFHQHAQASHASLSDEIARLLNTRIDLQAGPPVRFHWFPAGSGESVVCMHFHHALTDGYGALAFLKAVLDSYRDDEGAAVRVAGAERGRPSSESRTDTARAFAGLLAHSARQARRHAFARPDKLFPKTAVASGGIAVEWRALETESPERWRGAARTAGVSVGSLVLAALAAGIAQWKREQDLPCRMLRMTVNVNLRRHELPGALGHTTSAFPIWLGGAELTDPQGLPKLVQKQIITATRKRFAEALRSLAVLMSLPAWIAQALLVPMLRNRTGTDSLVVTNMGDLSLPGQPRERWLRLGDGPMLDAYGFVRPVDGIGATVTTIESPGALRVCLTYIQGLIAPSHASRLLDLTVIELAKLCDA